MKSKKQMHLIWGSQNSHDWDNLLKKTIQANWMQSWPYAKAIYRRDYKSTRIALIRKENLDLGMVAIQEIVAGPVHFLEIHRGPLWFEPVTWELFLEFAELLRRTYPRRILRRLRWLPEWSFEEKKVSELIEIGFKPMPQTYETVLLNLSQSPSELRTKLNGKWRNGLAKAERSDLRIRVDLTGYGLAEFLFQYEKFKLSKKFSGPSSQFMREEFLAAQNGKNSFLLTAEHSGQVVAGVMLMIHGRCGSYRIGWNSELGKKTNAHSLLLWKAIEVMQAKGVVAFDLGGIKTEESPGLTHFKSGMGGESLRLLGYFS